MVTPESSSLKYPDFSEAPDSFKWSFGARLGYPVSLITCFPSISLDSSMGTDAPLPSRASKPAEDPTAQE